eukprot:3427004-Amphidinium_carterae.1
MARTVTMTTRTMLKTEARKPLRLTLTAKTVLRRGQPGGGHASGQGQKAIRDKPQESAAGDDEPMPN